MGFKKSTFNVNFLLRKHKLLRNGEAPICMRITVNNRAVDISIKRSVSADHWNQARESCTSTSSPLSFLCIVVPYTINPFSINNFAVTYPIPPETPVINTTFFISANFIN